MTIDLALIAGVMLGFEYVNPDETDEQHLVIDLFIVRLLFSW